MYISLQSVLTRWPSVNKQSDAEHTGPVTTLRDFVDQVPTRSDILAALTAVASRLIERYPASIFLICSSDRYQQIFGSCSKGRIKESQEGSNSTALSVEHIPGTTVDPTTQITLKKPICQATPVTINDINSETKLTNIARSSSLPWSTPYMPL